MECPETLLAYSTCTFGNFDPDRVLFTSYLQSTMIRLGVRRSGVSFVTVGRGGGG